MEKIAHLYQVKSVSEDTTLKPEANQQPIANEQRKTDWLRLFVVVSGLLIVFITGSSALYFSINLAFSPISRLSPAEQRILEDFRSEQRAVNIEIKTEQKNLQNMAMVNDKRITILETKLDMVVMLGWGILSVGGAILVERLIDWFRRLDKRKS